LVEDVLGVGGPLSDFLTFFVGELAFNFWWCVVQNIVEEVGGIVGAHRLSAERAVCDGPEDGGVNVLAAVLTVLFHQ
jgi:hypothetical protein